jgi:hypothetical protein
MKATQRCGVHTRPNQHTVDVIASVGLPFSQATDASAGTLEKGKPHGVAYRGNLKLFCKLRRRKSAFSPLGVPGRWVGIRTKAVLAGLPLPRRQPRRKSIRVRLCLFLWERKNGRSSRSTPILVTSV